jgi:type IV pilus assembly protein PilB
VPPLIGNQIEPSAMDLSQLRINPRLMKLIPADLAYKYGVLPVAVNGGTLVVAMADPSNIFAIDDIKFLTGYRIETCAAPEDILRNLLDSCYEKPEGVRDEGPAGAESWVHMIDREGDTGRREPKSAGEQVPVIRLVNGMINDAINRGASDIHIEPYEHMLRVRFRIDGVLYDVMQPSLKLKNAILSRIKIIARLDIAERRLPQDGRIKIRTEKAQEVDVRVSVLPTLFGEKAVLRLLDKSSLQPDMTRLGFEEHDLTLFKEVINYPFGMVLVTGPTGSGKTTTLYSALNALNNASRNICTVEDPVEYNLPGINQVQIHEEIGLTFAHVLRAFLRQDPDIILVGEIRDAETAEIAIKAALTGHLVLSTLHTNDAPGTVNRLIQMGIEPYLISSALTLVVAQRLVRKVCPHCKVPLSPPGAAYRSLGIVSGEPGTAALYRGAGCRNCNNTGFKGRVAIYEVLFINEQSRELILKGASLSDFKKEAKRSGMSSLRDSAVKKMRQGLTTPEEVLRATHAQ